MRRRMIFASLSLAASLAIVGCGSDGKPLKMSIYHINDSHSHLDSERMSFKLNGTKKIYYDAGGYARIATKLKALREKNPNSLTLHAGDVFQGTLYYSLYKGDADAAVMSKLGFDAYTLGNHSFDDGDDGYKHFLDKLLEDGFDGSVLSANIVPQEGNELVDYWKPYTIKEVGGQKVGIVGITVSGKTKNSSNPSDEIAFLDELTTAQKYIDELEDKGVDKIILLTHQGYKTDMAMAKKLKGVDVIVGGDSHTYLGDFGDFATASGEYPTKVEDANGDKVCIVQAGQYTKILGDLDVAFDADGRVESCSGTPIMLIGDKFLAKNDKGDKIEVDDTTKGEILSEIRDLNGSVQIIAEDDSIAAALKPFKENIDVKKAEKIGTAAEELTHIRIPGHNYGDANGSLFPLGSEIAPIVAKAFYDEYKPADACIQNAGGVRISVPAGKISYGTAYELLPFSNTIFEIKMTGSEVKQVLEDALSNFADKHGSTGSFPYAYGLRYAIDMTKGKNQRISELEIKDRKSGAWSMIDSNKLYTIVTNSYIAGGKDGYTTFKTVQDARGGLDTYLDYAMSFVNYTKKLEKDGKQVKKLPDGDHCIKSFKE